MTEDTPTLIERLRKKTSNLILDIGEFINYLLGKKVKENTPIPVPAPEPKPETKKPPVKTNKEEPSPPPKPIGVKFENQREWQEFLSKLNNFAEIRTFANQHEDDKFKWLKGKVSDAEQELKRISPPENFAEGAETMAKFLKHKYFPMWQTALENCNRSMNNSDKNIQMLSEQLSNIIDKYLSQAEMKSMSFKVGDDAEEWYNLCIEDGNRPVDVYEKEMDNKIIKIRIQPREFNFINSKGKPKKWILGGKCDIGAYKEG